MAASASLAAAPWHGHWLIVAAFVTQFVSVGVTNYAAGPFLAPMTEELGWTRAEFTIPRSLGGVVMAFTGFLIGARVDRFGARPFMLAGVLMAVAALWRLSATATLAEWIWLNGVLLAVGAALFGNLVVNVTLTKWFVAKRGQAVALGAMGVSFAGIGATPVLTWVIDAWGWRFAWQALAAATLLLALPFAFVMRRAPEDYGQRPDGRSSADAATGQARQALADFAGSLTRRQALRSASFYLLIVAFGLFVINIGVMLLHTVPFMTDAGYDRATAALMIVVASVPAMAAKPIWGHFIDRLSAPPEAPGRSGRQGDSRRFRSGKLGAKALAALGSAITGIAMLVILAGVAAKSLPGACAGFFLLGVGWGGMIPLQEVIWASFFGRRYIGAVRSAALPFALIFGAGAPLAVSWHHDAAGNYNGALLAVAAANLIAAAMILTIRAPRRRT